MLKIPEYPYIRKRRMLHVLDHACQVCTICTLGRNDVRDKNPHVFSNINPKRFVILALNPGWTELVQGTPLIDQAGEIMGAELYKNGLCRDDFYITNLVKCYSDKPTIENMDACAPFLSMELKLIEPLLVVALGPVVFNRLCPDSAFLESVGKVVFSPIYNVNVYSTFHPLSKNLAGRRREFEDHVSKLCKLVKILKARHDLELDQDSSVITTES